MTSSAAIVAVTALAALSSGCAAMMNGISDRITARSPTPGARVYVDGFDATDSPVVVPNDRPHVLLVRAPGYRDRVIELEPHVKPLPIALDAVLAVPTLLIAPLVDLSVGWWTAIDDPDDPVALEPEHAVAGTRPTYAIGGRVVHSMPGAIPPDASHSARASEISTATDAKAPGHH